MEKPLKRLSIFFIFIFFISILGVIYRHHEDGIPHDDCFICSTIDNNTAFLTQDTYQTFSNDSIISIISTVSKAKLPMRQGKQETIL